MKNLEDRIMELQHSVPLPRGKIKEVREWLLENIGLPDDEWSITVDIEVVEYFRHKTKPPGEYITEIFVIKFKNEEDKVKFILKFL